MRSASKSFFEKAFDAFKRLECFFVSEAIFSGLTKVFFILFLKGTRMQSHEYLRVFKWKFNVFEKAFKGFIIDPEQSALKQFLKA